MNRFFPAQRMLVGCAIGDAYGMGYEFRAFRRDLPRDPELLYLPHVLWGAQGAHERGVFSDDCQTTMAVAEAMLEGRSFTRELTSEFLLSCYRRDPVAGYSGRVEKALRSSRSGSELLERLSATSKSKGNGAAIRAMPLGLFGSPLQAVESAMVNASVAHDTASGIGSSVAVALMAHYFYYQVRDVSLFDFIESACADRENCSPMLKHLGDVSRFGAAYPHRVGIERFVIGDKEVDGIPCDGILTAGAVFYLLSHFHDGESLLKEAIRLGGDTDSVASVALSLHAVRSGLEDLPPFLFEELTNRGPWRRDYLLELGRRLHDRFPTPSSPSSP